MIIYIYIIMEYLENYKDISKIINTIYPELFCKIVTNMCNGLKLIHSLNIAHNDIKPENIMVNNQGNIKYIDFGGSCFNNECNNMLTFTPEYIDPNVYFIISSTFKFFSKLNLKTAQQGDLWSLGIVIYFFMIKKYAVRKIWKYNALL